MLNYFRFKKFNNEYLLTNDFGQYIFLTKTNLKKLLDGTIDCESECGHELQSKYFLYQGSGEAFTKDHTHLMRDSKNYVFSATSLHIFVVTNACNMNCIYCQANNGINKPSDYMDAATAERAVDIALSSPALHLSFEFQGGEPLLNYPIIQHIIEYTEQHKGDKEIHYSLVSNLTLLTDDMIQFLKEYNVDISTSLDGYEQLHNQNRPYRTEDGTFRDVLNAVERLRNTGLNVGAIQTTVKESLSHAREIVDAYCENGFNSLFLRPLTPLGCAKQKWKEIGYTPQEFTAFYKEAILYIIEKNRCGTQLQEGHAATLFSKILHGYPVNYMELRSPCGASVGQMAYYTNGDVFTCDEGRMMFEMGDDAFRLGNVYQNCYEELVRSSTCRAVCISSITEAIPSCCDCVYQPFCGVCPVVNYALYGDLLPKTPHHYRCGIYSGILDTLFELLQKNDKETVKILESWYA